MAITRVWQTGCELGSFVSEFTNKIGNYDSQVQIVSGMSKTGDYSLRIGDHGTSYYGAVQSIPSTLQFGVGFHIWNGDSNQPNQRVNRFTWRTIGDSVQGNIIHKPDSAELTLWIGGVQKDSYSPVVKDQWYHIGLDVKAHATEGWAKVYLDGGEILSFTGSTIGNAIERLVFGAIPMVDSHSGFYTYYDDIVINDTTGEESPAPVDDLRFELLVPNGTGTYSQWRGSDGDQIDNYLLVDEIPPNGADYVSATGTSYIDSYALKNYTLPQNASVEALIPISVAKKGDASSILLVPGVRLGSDNNIPTGSASALGTSYGQYVFTRHTGTPTGDPWGESDVNNAQYLQSSYGSFL